MFPHWEKCFQKSTKHLECIFYEGGRTKCARRNSEQNALIPAFWQPLFDFFNKLGIPEPDETKLYACTGALNPQEASGPIQLGMWYLSIRCLYAEMVGSREDKKIVNTISRLKAYGSKWRKWAQCNENTPKPHIIPKEHREKS